MRRLFGFLSITVMLVVAGGISAQDIGPVTDFSADDGPWGTAGNWSNGTPEDGVLARVGNAGQADAGAGSTAGNLSITDGAVSVGGDLTVTDHIYVGPNGHLHSGGAGSVKSGSLGLDGQLTISPNGIEVAGAAYIGGGTINVPEGTQCSLPFDPIPFMTAGQFGSGQPSIPASASCPDGLAYAVQYDGNTASINVEPVAMATVNRTSGSITVASPAGALEMKGYEFTSGNALLSADNWNSLTDQGSEGWAEASPSSERLTELNLTGSSTLSDPVDLGAAWAGTTATPRAEDVQFTYLLADGREFAGAVEYTGPANDLVLQIDASGNGTLQNLSASVGDFDVVGYSILSASGSLNVAGFTGLGEGWTNANPQAVALAELNLEGSKVFSNGTTADLGNIFSDGGTEDLQLFFGVAGSENQQPGTVEYGMGESVTCADVRASRAIDGDLNGDNAVNFTDFLVLSTNFNTAQTMYEEGDIDCNGTVAFPDFLVLSTNFGQEAGATAASVPEPTAGLLAFIGILGMLKFRKRGLQIAALMVVAGVMVTPNQAWAQGEEFDVRFIRLHPDGANNQINNTTEARGILEGVVYDVIVNEDLTEPGVFTVDFGGGAGSFSNDQNPYSNGVDNDSMNDILQYVSGTVTIPEGDWTVGIGRDDGGFLRLTDLNFINTFSEQQGQGTIIDGDGEILYDGTGGHNWTAGTITVPAGGITTGIEAMFFERGGGDSFEVAYVDAHFDPDVDGALNAYMAGGFELDNGEFGDWVLTGNPFDPGNKHDINQDGNVDLVDYQIMLDNWGNPYGFDDFVWFADEFNSAPAGAASVPEPAGLSLLIIGFLGLTLSARRRARR